MVYCFQDHLRRQDPEGAYNIIHMLDHFNFRNHKCITFELLSINLYELIKKNKFQGFSLQVYIFLKLITFNTLIVACANIQQNYC